MLDNVASFKHFIPEMVLSVGVLAILVADLVARGPDRLRAGAIALGTLAVALVATIIGMSSAQTPLFGGLIVADPFASFFKLLFIVTSAVICVTAQHAKDTIDYAEGEHHDKESGEFYALILTSTVGMMLMAASTDLLMAYLSLETVSMLSYILAGFKRRDRRSSEAALKYVIYGGVASGVMLYGLSLLYGLAGSTNMAVVQAALAHAPADSRIMVIAAVTLSLCGFGYKVAAVPFHMWCPDVYEGAPTTVTAFFSVAPKAAGFALLIRFFAGAVPADVVQGPWPLLLGVVAAATMTLGNLAAIVQNNVKRMLAYSSIAHAGYLMLGLCAATGASVRAMLVYLVTYVFMNLGAFLVVIAMSEAGVGETIDDYRGLGYRARIPALVLGICLFSLTGLPPFAGFFGKFYLFASLLEKGGSLLLALALVGILNSAVSLYYYARLLKAMYFEPAVGDSSPVEGAPVHLVTMGLMGAATALLFMAWTPLMRLIDWAYPNAQMIATALIP